MILDGTATRVERNAYCCDTTGIYSSWAYHEEMEIEITYVGKSTIEIDGNIWEKNGKSLSFETASQYGGTFGAPKGGSSSSTEKYNGTMVSNQLIQGEFRRTDFSVVYSSRSKHTVTQGNFVIKKK